MYEEITDGQDILKVGNREVNGRAYCASFNFRGPDQQKKVGDLSGGERNRVHLAKLLRSGGNVLLLDEPTNDLDVDTLRALEDALESFPGCAVVISHDRWFLDRIATHMLAFEGDSQVRWFEGNFSEYETAQAQGARRRGGPAASHQVQAAHPLTRQRPVPTGPRLASIAQAPAEDRPMSSAWGAPRPRRSPRTARSRAVLRDVEPGSTVECVALR